MYSCHPPPPTNVMPAAQFEVGKVPEPFKKAELFYLVEGNSSLHMLKRGSEDTQVLFVCVGKNSKCGLFFS